LSPSNLQFAWPATASATVKFVLLGFTLSWLAFTYLGYGPHHLFGKGQVVPHSP